MAPRTARRWPGRLLWGALALLAFVGFLALDQVQLPGPPFQLPLTERQEADEGQHPSRQRLLGINPAAPPGRHTVLVNRGFVAPENRQRAQRREGEPRGPVTVTGLLRPSEPGGASAR